MYIQLECQDWEAQVADIFEKVSETPSKYLSSVKVPNSLLWLSMGITSFCTDVPVKNRVKSGIFMFEN